ncbi:sensor histidine kinase KdpD [Bacteroides sp. 51]|uniref:sensor histidine kinase n=1 Tax=Bacteroides sp. 51 TaxID=2302938 RepID=UPI0013D8A9D6|nr:HAMP domain-containing sensor histidine kinase [Bacteroides sp. 51]
MKEKHLKYLTIAALCIIGLLQLTWMLHTYSLQQQDIKVKVDNLFFEAAEKELYSRYNDALKNIPEGEVLDFGTISEDGQRTNDFLLFQELFRRYGSEISLTNLDSIFQVVLMKNDIRLKTSIFLIEGDSLTNKRVSADFGNIKTDLIPIKKDYTLYIQATLSSPYKLILTRITLLLAATAIMLFFVSYCIILQIRIIIRQNRIAQLRQDFSYAMVHDMKTPLTSIMVGTRMLESGKLDNSPDKKNTYIRIMKDEIQHLLALTNKVLTIAKLEEGNITLAKQEVLIMPIVNDLVEKFMAKKTKDIKFITYFATETVCADAEYLKEAISNLIDNAIKYSGESVVIEITCEEAGDYDQIKVKDNGFGISLKDQSLVFEKFERGAAVRRSSKGGATGFGLGLNYVQQVVAAHDGTVMIDSIEGKYSEFTICIPKLMGELE